MTLADTVYVFTRGLLLGFVAFMFCVGAFSFRAGYHVFGACVVLASLRLYWLTLRQVFGYMKERLDAGRDE